MSSESIEVRRQIVWWPRPFPTGNRAVDAALTSSISKESTPLLTMWDKFLSLSMGIHFSFQIFLLTAPSGTLVWGDCFANCLSRRACGGRQGDKPLQTWAEPCSVEGGTWPLSRLVEATCSPSLDSHGFVGRLKILSSVLNDSDSAGLPSRLMVCLEALFKSWLILLRCSLAPLDVGFCTPSLPTFSSSWLWVVLTSFSKDEKALVTWSRISNCRNLPEGHRNVEILG